ncbi:vitelline envelope sperm lysin receptor-like [Haliotis rufescens]|uniref:vitelline envelope sperm lysin receptor-like n=1 Tax=Haliotis rufescens TaxID=6454 RepID=UPI00201F3C1E|nr:vitelline envelope sperm lysin receptor-like [Haliotis rufescens]
MDRLAELVGPTLLVLSLLGLSEGQIGGHYQIKVKYNCPAEARGDVRVTIVTDVPETYPYAVCNGRFGFDFIRLNTHTWYIDVHFETYDPRDVCSFEQNERESYTLRVYVPTSNGLVSTGIPTNVVTCNYQPQVDADTPENLIVSSLAESKKPVKQLMSNMGPLSKSGVDLFVADITGQRLRGNYHIGRLVRLKARLIGNFPAETSFHAVSCKAISGKETYVVLNGGCGDGTIFDRYNGFTTTGKVSVSPIFRFFRMGWSLPLSFECIFVICKNCDGDSCEDPVRRRRHLGPYEEKDTYKNKHIMTARVDIPTSRQTHLTNLITHESPVAPEDTTSRIVAEKDIPGSEVTEDLILTVVMASIIPLVSLVVIMLIFIVAISRVLRSMTVMYRDLNRQHQQIIDQDIKEDIK